VVSVISKDTRVAASPALPQILDDRRDLAASLIEIADRLTATRRPARANSIPRAP